MSKTINVVQSPEKDQEVPTEVLAESIVAISQGIKKLRTGRLNDRALVLLIQHAAPMTGGKYKVNRVGTTEIRAVLEGIDALEATYLKKRTS